MIYSARHKVCRTLLLTETAKGDIAGIRQYSIETWGDAQAGRYMASLAARLRALARNPALARPRPELEDGVHSSYHRPHLIYLTETEDAVVILRVLHERQDQAGVV